jgi:antitoxin (DNA-binding transcriptional repressor) of toxin-antitoxin stability system
MRQDNMHEAKTHLARLVDEAAAGDSFVICKAGEPMVGVTPLTDAQAFPPAQQRLGLVLGECSVPEILIASTPTRSQACSKAPDGLAGPVTQRSVHAAGRP